MQLFEDNVSPNDGTYFTIAPPEEQEIERKHEKARTLEALPVLKEMVEHFDNRINFYNSVDSIPARLRDDPVKFMHAYNANEIVKKCLISEREYIVSLLDSHAKNL